MGRMLVSKPAPVLVLALVQVLVDEGDRQNLLTREMIKKYIYSIIVRGLVQYYLYKYLEITQPVTKGSCCSQRPDFQEQRESFYDTCCVSAVSARCKSS